MTTARIDSIDSLRALIESHRPTTVGFVPTMGALHDGHAHLIDRARAECRYVVVSIFVNPLQFDRSDDLERYPRTIDADLRLCSDRGVDVVFIPSVSDLYPVPPSCTVDVGHLADHLCGRHRAGHFRGVATIVLKLLQIVQPDYAYFGEKDAQQLAIVQRMVNDFNVPAAIVGVPTVREADGLALSSRNRHLSESDRQLAPSLHSALREADRLIRSGATDPVTIVDAARRLIPLHPSLRVEYFEIVDPVDLQPVSSIQGSVLIAGALWIGATRLIDNVQCHQTTSDS